MSTRLNKLERYKQKHSLTYAEVARLLGVSQQTYSNWRNVTLDVSKDYYDKVDRLTGEVGSGVSQATIEKLEMLSKSGQDEADRFIDYLLGKEKK